jgi:L-histidine N-alpha-methyltransferase
VELHLEAIRDVAFSVAGRPFSIQAGETIHTENSYKYRLEEIRLLARAAGWESLEAWSDPEGLFSLQLWGKTRDRIEP